MYSVYIMGGGGGGGGGGNEQVSLACNYLQHEKLIISLLCTSVSGYNTSEQNMTISFDIC